MRRHLLVSLAFVAGCAARNPVPISPSHPANADAPTSPTAPDTKAEPTMDHSTMEHGHQHDHGGGK